MVMPALQGNATSSDGGDRPGSKVVKKNPWGSLKKAITSKNDTVFDKAKHRDAKALYKNMKQSYRREKSADEPKKKTLDFTDPGFIMGMIAILSRSFLPLFGREAHFFYLRYLVVVYFALCYYCAKGWGNSESRFKSVYGSVAYYLSHLAIQVIVPLGVVYRPEAVSAANGAFNDVILLFVPAGIAYDPGAVSIVGDVANWMMLYFMLKSDAILGRHMKKKQTKTLNKTLQKTLSQESPSASGHPEKVGFSN